jgi:superfamily II DNA/RNA helicase
MTPWYREEEFEAFKKGDIWGMDVTDTFGMVSVLLMWAMQVTHIWQGLDLPDVKIVMQWKLRCTMCTLWQRIGRAA